MKNETNQGCLIFDASNQFKANLSVDRNGLVDTVVLALAIGWKKIPMSVQQIGTLQQLLVQSPLLSLSMVGLLDLFHRKSGFPLKCEGVLLFSSSTTTAENHPKPKEIIMMSLGFERILCLSFCHFVGHRMYSLDWQFTLGYQRAWSIATSLLGPQVGLQDVPEVPRSNFSPTA